MARASTDITTRTYISDINISELGFVIYQQVTDYFENNVPLTQKVHRVSLCPGDDLTDCPTNVADICRVVWTPDVIQAYQTLSAQTP